MALILGFERLWICPSSSVLRFRCPAATPRGPFSKYLQHMVGKRRTVAQHEDPHCPLRYCVAIIHPAKKGGKTESCVCTAM